MHFTQILSTFFKKKIAIFTLKSHSLHIKLHYNIKKSHIFRQEVKIVRKSRIFLPKMSPFLQNNLTRFTKSHAFFTGNQTFDTTCHIYYRKSHTSIQNVQLFTQKVKSFLQT